MSRLRRNTVCEFSGINDGKPLKSNYKQMKQILTLFLFLTLAAKLSAQINDDFSDGNFTANPAWTGDAADYIVNPQGQLQLNTTGEDESYLVTSSSLADSVQWEFWIKQAFSPSANNNGRVYLISDQQNIKSAPVNGYFLQFGESGSNDAIELFRQDGSSYTSVCRGTDGLISGSFEMRIRVIRKKSGEWQIYADPSGGNNFQLEASGNDNTYKTSSWFGFFCNYTTSNADKFYFDDVSVAEYTPDTTAPSVKSLSVLSSSELVIEFSESVVKQSAEFILNYSVDKGIGNPASAVQDPVNPRIVTLTFSSNFVQAQQYELSIKNVEDPAGNTINAAELFTFYKAMSGDIVINEIMADPTPQVGLPDAEYLEIFNASSFPVSLDNWSLKIGSAVKSFGSITIKPDSFLILCDDSDVDLFKNFGMVYGFSSLSLANTGNSLSLMNGQHQVIHYVNYSDSWYKDAMKKDGGWSLEQMDPQNACAGGSNWLVSNAMSGGTPGSQNSVFTPNPDIVPPALASVSTVDTLTLLVRFTETIDSTVIKNASAYLIDNGIGNPLAVQAVAPSYQSVILHLPASLKAEVLYTLEFTDTLRDCSGNSSSGNSLGFALYEAGYHDVIITEIMARPSDQKGLPDVEYVELHNTTGFPIDVGGWTFSYSGNIPKRISSQVIQPDSFIVLCDDDDRVEMQQYSHVATVSSLSLPNNGTELLLTDSLNRTIDFVEYSSDWYQNDYKENSDGWSLEMVDTDFPCVGDDNWRASKSPNGGTPGAVNSVAASNPDFTPPQYISTIYVNPSMFIIELSESMLPEDLPQPSAFEVPGIGNALHVQLISPGNERIQVLLPAALNPDSVYHLLINDSIIDCAGNLLERESVPVAIPSKPDEGDILINEVLFEAPDGTSDFVEIINNSGKPVYLDNINLVYIDADDYSRVSETEPDTEKRIMFDGDIWCYTEERKSLGEAYLRCAKKNIFELDYLPSLPSDHGILLLRSSFDAAVVDSMKYSGAMHNAMLKETRGVSLERISPRLPSVMNENWTSAAETAGFATPGFVNSQYNQISNQHTGEVTLEYKMFTPNGDGDRDVLIINYRLDQPGYVGNVRIYDRNGREIRELHNNVLMETEGSFIWDGVNNDAAKAAVGIYLIYVEVFDASGKAEKYKVIAVLGGRL